MRSDRIAVVLAPVLAWALAASACAPTPEPSQRTAASQQAAAEPAVRRVLDDFHDAASDADFNRYFGHFAEGGVFIGTDATEHWTVEEFRDYARPHFDAGRGWTYRPTQRHVYLSADGRTAWFDELLDNAGLGLTRGTGVLVQEDGAWRVAQYHLTIPVPNELADTVVAMIRRRGGE